MATKQFQNAKLNVTHLDLKDDASRSVLQSGENISHSLGKIARWYKDIIWTDSKATTEVFGIVKLSDDYKSESIETVPTSKTLNDVVKLMKQTGGWNTTYDFNSNIEGDENLQNGQFKVTEHDLEGDIDHYVSIKGLGSAAYTESSAYATAGHTHKYAGSDSVGGPAISANKLNTDAGSDINPIYFSNGIPVACTYSLNKTVPSNALFTDENVTQTVTTTNENFEILFSGTADNTTRTEGARKNSNLTFNPSTGILTATKFVGALSGNATSATTANKLSNTTAIGSSTKPVYFSADGIPVAIDHSIETSVPSNAVFTDTTYTVSSGDNNGQIKVTPSEGDPYNVSVKGLGSAAYTDSDEYATAGHTHKYAGSSSVGGVANSAAKLSDIPTAGIGSETKPVFFSGTTGRPVACTYSLNTTVPANAIFTDEKVKQSPVTTDGSFEVLFAGSTGNTAKTEGVSKTTTLTFNPSTGALSATSFTGNGSGLTSLNASNISSGTLAVDRLPGSAVTIGTYGPAAGGTLSHSGTFDVPDFTVDAKGRVTGAHTRTFTLPAQYTHPTHTSKASGLYKITVDSLGHVSGTAAVTKSDIPALDYISSTTTRNPNVVLAGPASGTTAAAPTFRALVAADLPSSGATAGSYGPSANATPGYGATFNVPYITVDAKGRVTAISTKTVKIPASDNTDTKVTQTATTTSAAYEVLLSGTADNTTRTEGARKSNNLLFNPSTGVLQISGTEYGAIEIYRKGSAYGAAIEFYNDATNNTKTKLGSICMKDVDGDIIRYLANDSTTHKICDTKNTSFTRSLSSGTKIGTITIAGTSMDLYCQTNTNTTYSFATGDTNGTFKVTPSGGSATNIAIKGLGSAAYTASSAYAAASHTHNYAGSSTAGGVANSAAKLSTARTINGVKFDGTADIIVPRSIKHIHYANGTNGTSGYVKICTVGTNAAYGDQPIRITIGQRRISVYDIFIVFENSGSAKATIRDAYFRSNRLAKQSPEVHYYLNSNGYYDIYVKKTESQDHIFIMDYLKSDRDEGDHVELTWTNTLVSTLPSGSVKMLNEMDKYYLSTISRAANTVLAAPNGSTGKATFRALVAADLPASGATAGSYGPSANATPGYGATFNVPYITVDAKGRVTAISTKTVKIPASDNTNTTYTFATGDNNGTFKVTPSGGTATNIAIKGLGSAAYTASSAYAAASHTHKYAGSSSAGGPAYSVEGGEGTTEVFRHVWFSTDSVETKRAYSDKFMFEPSSGILKFNSWYPLDITDNTVDLNSYNDGSGKYGYRRYICRSTGGGNKISNKPCDSPFLLEVFLIRFATASSDYITKQVYHAFNKKTYQRFCTNGTWDSWTELKYTDTNTDTKVTQTATTTSAAYEVLFSGTADNTTRTEGARKNSNLTFNPSTGVLTTDRLYSARNTGTYLAGNKGSAIINSTASAGAYVMLARMHSTNGYFTHGTYQSSYLLQYTVKSTIDAGTNAVTKSVTLLNESGNSSFPGTVTASTFSGSGASLTSLNASNISSGTLSADRLATSGATAGSYGPSANATPGYGATFNVPYITVDAKGRVTAISTKTVKIPASDNTNTTYSFATGDTNGTFKVTPSGGTATNIAIKGLGSAAYTNSSAYATSGHAHGLGHSNFTVAIDSTTNTWAAIGVDGTNKYVLKSIRTNTNAPPYLLNDFSAGIVFGGEDTRGVISMKYNTPSIRFAGGNRTAADGGTAKWYITLTGTHNTTYNLDTINQVTQTATTTSAAYEVLFSGTADNTTRTEGVRKNSNLTFNPSTGVLTATKFDGQIVGKKYDDYDPFSTKHDYHPVLFYQDSFGSPSKVGYASLDFTYDSIHGDLFSGGMNCGVLNTKIINMSGTTDDPNSEINYKGTKATHTMIKFINNAGDTSGNGIVIGGGGLVVVGAGESANNLVSAASLPGGQEKLYLTSDSEIYFYINCNTIGDRKGMTLNTALSLYPTTNNTGSVGTSSYKWASMYATTFYGALSGNATTATTAKKLKYCTLCNEASDAATYPWYRIAYAYTTNAYSDLNLVMMVTCGFGSKWGIFKARARTEGKAGTFGGTVTIEWIVNDGFTNAQLYLLTKNNYQVDTAKSGTATAEIWFKSDGRYWGYTFTVLHEGWRTGTSSDLWALSSYSKNGSENYNKNASGIKSAASSKIYSTNTPGSSTHAGYSIPFFSGPIDSSSPEKNDTAASGNKTVLHNGEFRLGLLEGTTSANGYAQLVLGNGIASGTAGNKYGKITLYSSSTYAVQIIPAKVKGTRTLTLPDASGTVALTSHTHSYIPTSSAATLFSGTAAASITMTSMSGYTRLVVFCKNTSNSSYFTVELQCTTGYHYHAMTVSPPPAAQTSNSFYGLLFNLSSNTKLSVSAGKYSNLSSSASLANGPTVHITKVLGYKF